MTTPPTSSQYQNALMGIHSGVNIMTYRISIKDLEMLALRINEATNSPIKPYADGKAQVGNYHISQAYGGVCLHRMHSEGGAVTTPLCSYHEPKRDLYNRMQAFIASLEA